MWPEDFDRKVEKSQRQTAWHHPGSQPEGVSGGAMTSTVCKQTVGPNSKPETVQMNNTTGKDLLMS